MKNSEIKEELLQLILEALAREIITYSSENKITKENYLTVDYFSFRLLDRDYDVTFKDKFSVPGKQIELIRRGSNFIKDLLSHIFNNYNLLYIFNATSSYSIKNIVLPKSVHGMVVQAKEILRDADEIVSEDFQYQVNFLIDIRDTITGFTTNKKLISGLSVKYNERQEPIYYSQEFNYSDNSSDNGIQILQTETLMKLRMLTEKLKESEEKVKILEAFRTNSNTDIFKYLEERDILAKSFNSNEVNFEYNITPITIYAIKPRKKIVNYSVTYGSYVGQVELIYNHTGDIKYRCPNCDKELRTKFVYAKKEHNKENEYILACKECATHLDGKNSVYHDDGWYLNDSITTFIKNDRELKVLKSDVGLCEIDQLYYYKEDLVVYDYIKEGSNWIPNERKLASLKRYVVVCKNCNTVLVAPIGEGLYYGESKKDLACFNCINKEKTNKIKKEYILSELSGLCYPASKAELCSNCGKIVGKSERITCRACNEVICSDCHEDGICKHCLSALKSDLSITKFPLIWKNVRNNILLNERDKNLIKIDIDQHLHSDNNELRLVFRRDGKQIIYYFYDYGGKYIYKGRRKIHESKGNN